LQAITYHRYGAPDVLELEEVDAPALAEDEVLVRVRAASVNPRDWHYLRGLPYVMRPIGLRIPKDGGLGSDVAGQVEAVGRAVTRFRPGDEVYAFVLAGGFAEYVRVPEGVLGPKPANLSFEQAATVPLAALTALQGLRDQGRVEPGDKVLIIGASGGVGTFAVQLAEDAGAEVTATCRTDKVAAVRALGADVVLDHTREDVLGGERRYDVVLDIGGNRRLADLRRALTPRGRLVIVGGENGGRWLGGTDRQLRAQALSPFVAQQLGTFVARENAADLRDLAGLLDAGRVTPVLDRCYPLADTAAAIRRLLDGDGVGKVVVTVP
jgi:NADPH:quinone reductase-like Zn-dependent oxidoreductase